MRKFFESLGIDMQAIVDNGPQLEWSLRNALSNLSPGLSEFHRALSNLPRTLPPGLSADDLKRAIQNCALGVGVKFTGPEATPPGPSSPPPSDLKAPARAEVSSPQSQGEKVRPWLPYQTVKKTVKDHGQDTEGKLREFVESEFPNHRVRVKDIPKAIHELADEGIFSQPLLGAPRGPRPSRK
jgi:hypothetical protein